MGPPSCPVCQQNLNTFIRLCSELGVPLSSDKVEGPATTLSFLGIILDTQHMEIILPPEKFTRIQVKLEMWLGRRKATKWEILSLVGLLQHATKVVRPGRTYVARMYVTAAKLREMHFITRLNKEFRSDLIYGDMFS